MQSDLYADKDQISFRRPCVGITLLPLWREWQDWFRWAYKSSCSDLRHLFQVQVSLWGFLITEHFNCTVSICARRLSHRSGDVVSTGLCEQGLKFLETNVAFIRNLLHLLQFLDDTPPQIAKYLCEDCSKVGTATCNSSWTYWAICISLILTLCAAVWIHASSWDLWSFNCLMWMVICAESSRHLALAEKHLCETDSKSILPGFAYAVACTLLHWSLY